MTHAPGQRLDSRLCAIPGASAHAVACSGNPQSLQGGPARNLNYVAVVQILVAEVRKGRQFQDRSPDTASSAVNSSYGTSKVSDFHVPGRVIFMGRRVRLWTSA